MAEAAELERREDGEEKAPRSSRYWCMELKAAHNRVEAWHKRGSKVIERYEDETKSETSSRNTVNILWSNTEVLKSALYGASAKPDVRRRFPDRSDPIKRIVAEVLERSLSFTCDQYDFDRAIELALEDALLPGMGVLWARYEPELGDEGEIYSQQVEVDHIHWKDFRWGHAREWRDVPWVARLHILRRSDIERAFGKAVAKDVPLSYKEEGVDRKDEDDDIYKRAGVWEIWDKSKRERVYVVDGYDKTLGIDPDPYGLKDFFPCAEPMALIRKPGSIVPIPMFTLYQDQAEELDTLSTRIYHLTDNLRYRGVYDASNEENAQLKSLATAADGEFLPAKSFRDLAEGSPRGNAIDAVVSAEPIKERAEVIAQLIQQRIQAVQTIYELTGISDIIRGASDPNETATAQRLKGQFGSMRLNKMQKAVQKTVRDIFRIKAELVAEHYTPETLAAITGIELPTEEMVSEAQMSVQVAQFTGQPPEPQVMEALEGPNWPAVMQILRSDERRGYAVDVETDSTVLQDEQADKAARTEFLQAMQQLIGQGMAALKESPQILPLVKELVMFAMRGFHIGRTMEETVEDTFERLEEELRGGGGGEGAGDQAKAQADERKAEMQAQTDMAALQQEGQIEQQKLALQREKQVQDHEIAQKQVAIDAIDTARSVKETEVELELKRGAQNAEQAQNAVFPNGQ